MQRFLSWINRRADQNIVSYSRFGLPGEEQDDKPPPTSVHVAPFDEDSKEFLTFGTHSQRAAVISVGIGMSLTIFIVLSAFFEFDWYQHDRGVDFSALIGLFLFLVLGLAIHWSVIKGIKTCDSKLLVPFIIIYSTIIFAETAVFIFSINHWLTFTYLNSIRARESEGFLPFCIVYAIVLLIQSSMLHSVTRCRHYLDRKSVHNMEMRLVEKIKNQYPGINVVYGAGNPVNPNIGIANSSVGEVSNGSLTAPPSYENATVNNNPSSQRTILQAEDGIL